MTEMRCLSLLRDGRKGGPLGPPVKVPGAGCISPEVEGILKLKGHIWLTITSKAQLKGEFKIHASHQFEGPEAASQGISDQMVWEEGSMKYWVLMGGELDVWGQLWGIVAGLGDKQTHCGYRDWKKDKELE